MTNVMHSHVQAAIQAQRDSVPETVEYRGTVYSVVCKGYLGRPDMYKLASATSSGAPFGALIRECTVVTQ